MRKMGIKCVNEEEKERSGLGRQRNSSCTGVYTDACKSCGLYKN